MGRRKKEFENQDDYTPMRPGISPEARENQLISLAIDLAERQLREGTASAQVITHYLKLGSTKERLEQEIMEKQKALMDAKTQMIQSTRRIEETYERALQAMRAYSGSPEIEDPDRVEEYTDDYYGE